MKMDDLKGQILKLEAAGIDRFHLDVMDGVFVPNFALGYEDVKSICRLSSKPTELHLMQSKTSDYIDFWADAGVDIIFVHPEADYHPALTIQKIRRRGVKPGIVINPGMSVDNVFELLRMVNYVIVMGVNPGFAGQIFFSSLGSKIQRLIELKKEFDFELELDGGCSTDIIKEYSRQGVDSFVLGNNGFFKENTSYSDTMKRLRVLSGDAVSSTVPNQPKIKILITDCDGTLTDGKIYMGENCEIMKAFNIKDGYALHEMLPAHEITPVIVTGRNSEIVITRAKELGIGEVYQGVSNKQKLIVELAQKYNCNTKEIAYIGDDMNDLGALSICGFKSCPADAVNEVRDACDYISPFSGGAGAVRDICEKVIKNNKTILI